MKIDISVDADRRRQPTQDTEMISICSQTALLPTWAAPVVFAVGLLSACAAHHDDGDVSPAPEVCAEITPCGGDLAGTWTIDSACLVIPSPFAPPECQAVITNVDVMATGTVTYVPSATNPSAGTQNPDYTL